eukprot:4691335-Prorocentrum_lima.AAC.1
MTSSLVGSEMCIRDSLFPSHAVSSAMPHRPPLPFPSQPTHPSAAGRLRLCLCDCRTTTAAGAQAT